MLHWYGLSHVKSSTNKNPAILHSITLKAIEYKVFSVWDFSNWTGIDEMMVL